LVLITDGKANGAPWEALHDAAGAGPIPEAIASVEFATRRACRYVGVPPEVHVALMRAESRGAFFNRRIRPRYR
jgi:hypothetical protein